VITSKCLPADSSSITLDSFKAFSFAISLSFLSLVFPQLLLELQPNAQSEHGTEEALT